MMRSIELVSLLLLSTLVACAAADATPAETPQKTQAATANADRDLCVAVMQHARTCTDQYLGTLVDARAAADHPAGIKDEVAKDRAGVIALAKQEWATDSTDANIEAMCARPNPHAAEQRDAVTQCQAATDCAAFSACIVPVEQAMWQ